MLSDVANKQKRAVIFGGAGFIGHHLAANLLARGYGEIVSADIDEPRQRLAGVRYVKHDVRRPVPVDLAGGPVDEVFNLAAVHRTPGHADEEYFETNVAGANNVCAYCRETGAHRLVFTSSIAVYGAAETPKDETADPTPNTAYGKSKLEAESIHRFWGEEDPARRRVIVRPAAIFGPGEKGNFTRLARALRMRMFIYPGRRDTKKSCGHVDELVESIMFAVGLDRPFFCFNFCYPTAHSIGEICGAFHKVAGYPAPRIVAPLGLLMAIARCAEALETMGLKTGIHRDRVGKLVRSTHIVPRELTAAGYAYRTDLVEGLRLWQDADPGGQFQ